MTVSYELSAVSCELLAIMEFTPGSREFRD